MLTRRLARLPTYLAARAVDAGLARGGTDYARFVVLGWYRTGSNLLLSLLNSDPAVVAYSELFSPRGLFWGNRAYAPRDRTGTLERRRTEDAAGFLRDVVYRPYPRRVRAVGFKLFYPQLVVRPVPGLEQAVRGDDRVRVVHLRRRNLLRVLVSNRIANRTGQMASTSRAHAEAALRRAGRLTLDPQECEAYFAKLERRAAACEALFPAERLLQVTYEELAADRDRQVTRVRSFLGLTPRPSTTPLVRQAGRPLSELVENLDELREHFRRTPREEWFES